MQRHIFEQPFEHSVYREGPDYDMKRHLFEQPFEHSVYREGPDHDMKRHLFEQPFEDSVYREGPDYYMNRHLFEQPFEHSGYRERLTKYAFSGFMSAYSWSVLWSQSYKQSIILPDQKRGTWQPLLIRAHLNGGRPPRKGHFSCI